MHAIGQRGCLIACDRCNASCGTQPCDHAQAEARSYISIWTSVYLSSMLCSLLLKHLGSLVAEQCLDIRLP